MKSELKNAYFAGLIDGEGHIAIHPTKSGSVRPVIRVHMTCEKTIRSLHSYFGGSFSVKKVENLPNRKPQWSWEVTFRKACGVCEQLLPYLVIKQEVAAAIVEHYRDE